MEKIFPLITCEVVLCQHVCELVLGVVIFDLNLWIQIDSFKQPIKSNSVGSGYVSHCRTSSFNYHFDHGFVVLKNTELCTKMRRSHVRRNIINITQLKSFVLDWSLGCACMMGVTQQVSCTLSLDFFGWFGEEWNNSITESQRSSGGIPSVRKPASREIISASVELCETDVCFLHIQLIGTNVWLPNMHKSPPDVNFESSRSPAKSESWNHPCLHCCAVFPKWHVWNQTCSTFVTGFRPFPNRSCKFIHGP